MLIKNIIQESIKVKETIIADPEFVEKIENAANLCIESLRNNGKIHLMNQIHLLYDVGNIY